MSRQAASYEKIIFDIIREYNGKFYYEKIFRIIDGTEYKIKAEKNKEEMVGKVFVNFQSSDRIDYEIRYNRLVNLSEGYTLMVPGLRQG